MIDPNVLLQEMIAAKESWRIPFFDFVDASRREKGFSATPLILTDQLFKSEALSALHESMSGLHGIGIIATETMRQFDESCLAREYSELPKRYSALIAATIAYLCDEMEMEAPMWIWDVPALDEPWLVCGIEGLWPIIQERCPMRFRQWKIFVLDNFLFRV